MIAKHKGKIGIFLLILIVMLAFAVRLFGAGGLDGNGYYERAGIIMESAEGGSSDYVLDEIFVSFCMGYSLCLEIFSPWEYMPRPCALS